MQINRVVPQKLSNNFVKLKNEDWLERLRVAGKCVASVMTMLEDLVKEKTNLSTKEMSRFAESEILKQNCSPTFKNYKGFPGEICVSVNQELVHGVPGDYKLQEGDLVSFDFGATYKETIADSAITCIFGEPKHKEHVEMIEATKSALYAGISSIRIGKKIGSIGDAIYRYARDKGFRVIEKYGGHGIDDVPHAQPFIPNKSNLGDGVRAQKGLTIAIEPLLVPYRSSINTTTGQDGWTVYTDEISAHAEHSIFVHDDRIEIITFRDSEKEKYSNNIIFER